MTSLEKVVPFRCSHFWYMSKVLGYNSSQQHYPPWNNELPLKIGRGPKTKVDSRCFSGQIIQRPCITSKPLKIPDINSPWRCTVIAPYYRLQSPKLMSMRITFLGRYHRAIPNLNKQGLFIYRMFTLLQTLLSVSCQQQSYNHGVFLWFPASWRQRD